jgi:UV DNA damage endonuclease
VIDNAIRDLEYHDELLSLLKLPPQEDRDAVMILHLGGTFGDKAATLDRFRENYKKLSQSVKNRLVLENDDVSWSVHDLLPLCEELNIPMVLDFHHHNIIFDSSQLREGTKDIMELFPRIKATWDRKNIKQKMHYSEPTPPAITGRQRRKHNPRPATLPPCPPDIDLMIEAKDKEQAVFELIRTFKLPGWDTFNNIVPHERQDDNKVLPKKAKKKKTKKQIAAEIEEFGKELSEEEDPVKVEVPEEEIGMGGPENRVYWPPGMEEWLRPKKREVKKKSDVEAEDAAATPANFQARLAATLRARKPIPEGFQKKLADATTISDVSSLLEEMKAAVEADEDTPEVRKPTEPKNKKAKPATAKKPAPKKMAKNAPAPTPSASDLEEEDDLSMPELSDDEDMDRIAAEKPRAAPARASGRTKAKSVSYKDLDEDMED